MAETVKKPVVKPPKLVKPTATKVETAGGPTADSSERPQNRFKTGEEFLQWRAGVQPPEDAEYLRKKAMYEAEMREYVKNNPYAFAPESVRFAHGVYDDAIAKGYVKAPAGYKPQPATPPPLPVPLPQVGQDNPQLVEALKGVIKERAATDTEAGNSYFYQGFSQYPEAVSQMIVRRLMTNRLQSSGPVSEWMGWVEDRLRNG